MRFRGTPLVVRLGAASAILVAAACAGPEGTPSGGVGGNGGGDGTGGAGAATSSTSTSTGGAPSTTSTTVTTTVSSSVTTSSAGGSGGGTGGSGGGEGGSGAAGVTASTSTTTTGSGGSVGGPPAPGENGASCADATQCDGGYCASELSSGFPAGYCYAFCTGLGSACADGGVCVDDGFDGFCYDTCTTDAHCRAGYECYDSGDPLIGSVCLPACTADAQCPETGICDDFQGICVQCVTDAHCGPKEICDTYYGECYPVDCKTDADCGAKEICDTYYYDCVAVECKSDADCAGPDEKCTAQNKCAAPEPQCTDLNDDDGNGLVDCEDPTCQAKAICTPGTAETGAPCSAPSDCKANDGDPICFTKENTSSYFDAGYCSEFCDPIKGTGCASANAICLEAADGVHGLCLQECMTDADCTRAGYFCTNAGAGSVCYPGCNSNDDCAAGQTCDVAQSFCVGATEADCGDLWDDDLDGYFDCEDSDCSASPSCVSGTAPAGAPCTASTDCAATGSDPACFTDSMGWPSGYCTEWCNPFAAGSCASGSECIDYGVNGTDSGLCLDKCVSSADCRAGYECEATEKVCFPK